MPGYDAVVLGGGANGTGHVTERACRDSGYILIGYLAGRAAAATQGRGVNDLTCHGLGELNAPE